MFLTSIITSCSLEGKNSTSVFVVVVEKLGVEKISCRYDDNLTDSRTNKISGFLTLCEEGVRFTHAFVNSTQTSANIATILTAKYPFEHGLRKNGESYLSSYETTTAELAHNIGQKTYFISAGAPILRYTNLNQGFEFFNDHFFEYPKKLFKPAKDIFSESTEYIKESPKRDFFAFHYLMDLAFPNTETKDSLGEVRAKKVESQIEEVDTQLGNFIQFLKKENKWNNSYFILVGTTDIDTADLHSANTQIALLVKPPSKPRDLGLFRTNDSYLSLIDVGTTLKDIYKQPLNSDESTLQRTSFLKFLLQTNLPDNEEPLSILIESPYKEENSHDSTENKNFNYALRKERFLSIFSVKDKNVYNYNTQIDRPEMLPQTKKINLALDSSTAHILANLQLIDLAQLTKESSIETESYRLKKRFSLQKIEKETDKKCKLLIDRILQKKDSHVEFENKCNDSLTSLALSYYRNEEPESIESFQKLFSTKYQIWKMDQNLAKTNDELKSIWFFDRPVEKSYIEYVFSKKEFKSIKDSLQLN